MIDTFIVWLLTKHILGTIRNTQHGEYLCYLAP